MNIVPREVLGRPTQRTALLLSRLPPWLGDRAGVILRRLTVGDLSRYGIGFDPYRPGGILGCVFRESARVVERIVEREAARVAHLD